MLPLLNGERQTQKESVNQTKIKLSRSDLMQREKRSYSDRVDQLFIGLDKQSFYQAHNQMVQSNE